ncbi:hypothetical protein, partial [Serratia marcescens]|uniref:hypothetical protein n=2 Tax=Serratia marcescens TaxID=615 RepID=UPI00203F369F
MGKQKSSHCDDEYILFAYSSYISVAARRVAGITGAGPYGQDGKVQDSESDPAPSPCKGLCKRRQNDLGCKNQRIAMENAEKQRKVLIPSANALFLQFSALTNPRRPAIIRPVHTIPL